MKSLYVFLIFIFSLSSFAQTSLFKVETTALCEFSDMLTREADKNSDFDASFICDNRYTIEVEVIPKKEVGSTEFITYKNKLIENIKNLSKKFQIIGFEIDIKLKQE